MSTKSTNTFSDLSPSASANAFSDISFTPSANSFSRVTKNSSANVFSDRSFSSGVGGFGGRFSMFTRSQNGWDGDNLGGGYYSYGTDFEGDYFGEGTFGGIRHFNK